jgi:hypothetical protein
MGFLHFCYLHNILCQSNRVICKKNITTSLAMAPWTCQLEDLYTILYQLNRVICKTYYKTFDYSMLKMCKTSMIMLIVTKWEANNFRWKRVFLIVSGWNFMKSITMMWNSANLATHHFSGKVSFSGVFFTFVISNPL